MTTSSFSLKLRHAQASPLAMRLVFILILTLNLLMALIISEQGRTIASQRALIRVLNRYEVAPSVLHQRLVRD